MRRKKGFKVVIGSLIVSTLISSQSFAISKFLDMPSDMVDKQPINKAVENKIIKGYKGYVKPNDKLTKAEMVTILNRLFNTPEPTKNYILKDVSENDWFYNDILKGIDSGIISLENGVVDPEATVSLEMASEVLERILNNQYSNINPSESSKLNVSVERLEEMLGNGNINSNKNKNKKSLKRSEFIRLIDQLVYTVVNDTGEYNLNSLEGNVLVKASEVVIKNSKIKGNLILIKSDTTKSVLILDNVTVGETILLNPGQQLILKNGSKVNKVIVNGTNKGNVNITLKDNSKVKTVISDNHVNISKDKNKKIDIYTKDDYKKLQEKKNEVEDPLLNDDYIIIEKPENKNPEVNLEDKDPEVKPEDKDPGVNPEDKDPEITPEDKDPETTPEDEDSEKNKELEEIKVRINSLPQEKDEILKSYNEVVELVVLFNSLPKDEKAYLIEEHIKLTKTMQVIQDNNILIQLEEFIETFKVDGIYNYETIILNKDMINNKLSLINHLSKPLDGSLKEDIDFLNNVLINEKAYKFIVEIEKLASNNYTDEQLLENREEVDVLVNGFLDLDISERDIVYKENHSDLEEIASRLEKLLHQELIDYLEKAILNLPEDRDKLLTMEDDLDELVNLYNYLLENNLGISEEYYEKLEKVINIIDNKDIYSIAQRIMAIPNSVDTILNYSDEIYKLIEKLYPVSNNDVNKLNLISDEYNYLLQIRATLDNKLALDFSMDNVDKIKEEILKLPTNVEDIFLQEKYVQELILRYNSLSDKEKHMLVDEYKYLRYAADIISGEKKDFNENIIEIIDEVNTKGIKFVKEEEVISEIEKDLDSEVDNTESEENEDIIEDVISKLV